MKILLAAINAKYIHSNPAIYCLRACAGKDKEQIELAEYTINHRKEDILADLYRRKPDVLAFSCYIWNRGYVSSLIRDFHLVLPNVPIWVGGPEVSYDAKDFLKEHPQVTGVMRGEGERSFAALTKYYCRRQETKGEEAKKTPGQYGLERIDGITWRNRKGEVQENPPAEWMDLDEIPFLYEDMEDFENRIIYYESSRGCPFSCSYCLSSIDKRVRFRSLALVCRELQFFLDKKVPQVKFVDRTFNCRHSHAKAIWRYIAEHDNGVTNFHFEIAADLLDEEEKEILASLRPGLAQLEIGVQSVNDETIREIDRAMDLEKLKETTALIRKGENIHQHLDLIAGLPCEDYESFIHSFDEVYAMHPQQLQLGFLKVLKGARMREQAKSYGLVYRQEPPYEVLYTRWISYEEILRLKEVEEMVEVYYNSGQFSYTLGQLEKAFAGAYEMFASLAEYYEEQGLRGRNHSRMARLEILRSFAHEKDGENREVYDELLLLDLYLRENSKSRPAWARTDKEYKEKFRRFFRKEEAEAKHLQGYGGYTAKQMAHMTHSEVFRQDVLKTGKELPLCVVFDYRRRDPLTGNAGLILLEEREEEKL